MRKAQGIWMSLLFSLSFWAMPAVAGGAEAIHGNVVVTLEGGLSDGGDRRADIEFEFAARQGRWPDKGWGYAMWFCRGHHAAVIAKREAEEDSPELEKLKARMRAKYGRKSVRGGAAIRSGATAWGLPLAAGPARIEGNTFTVGEAGGPTLSGVLVTPKLHPDSVSASGEGTYFAVFTLQKGSPPAYELEGEGLAAAVKVGARTVRFAGGTLVLE